MVAKTTQDLRKQAMKCKSANAAAILASIANWMDGIPATSPETEPHSFADLWVIQPGMFRYGEPKPMEVRVLRYDDVTKGLK